MAEPCRKFRYPSRDAALYGARMVCNKTGTRFGVLRIYRCDGCTVDENGKRAWHFGHRIGSGAASKRRKW